VQLQILHLSAEEIWYRSIGIQILANATPDHHYAAEEIWSRISILKSLLMQLQITIIP
jgi:hypothetical protein